MSETRRRRALLIAFSYPPAERSAGTLRAESLVRWLPRFGWDVTVLTAARNGAPAGRDGDVVRTPWVDVDAPFHAAKRALRAARSAGRTTPSSAGGGAGADAPDGTAPGAPRAGARGRLLRLERARIRALHFPDGAIGWYPAATREAVRLVREDAIDVVVSTSPPESGHLIARAAKRATGAPWVADFRDLWSDDPLRSPRPWPLGPLERRLERRVLRDADALITISGPYADRLRGRYDAPVAVVENGFEEADFQGDVAPLPGFTLTYAGEINETDRYPAALLRSVAALRDEGVAREGRFLVRFFGSSSYLLTEEVRRRGLDGLVALHGRVGREESIRRMRESSALLLLSSTDASAAGVFTTKLFEYLAAGAPILAVAPREGVVEDALRTTGRGVVAVTEAEIAATLRAWIDEHRKGTLGRWPLDDALRERWARRTRARAFAAVLERAARRA